MDVAEKLNSDQREAFMSRAKARGDHLLATQARTNEKSDESETMKLRLLAKAEQLSHH